MAKIDEIGARAANRMGVAQHHGKRIARSWFDGLTGVVSDYTDLVVDTVRGGSLADLVRGSIALSVEATVTAGGVYHQLYDACEAVTEAFVAPLADVSFQIDDLTRAVDPLVLGAARLADCPNLSSTDLIDPATQARIQGQCVWFTVGGSDVLVSLRDLQNPPVGTYFGQIILGPNGVILASIAVEITPPIP